MWDINMTSSNNEHPLKGISTKNIENSLLYYATLKAIKTPEKKTENTASAISSDATVESHTGSSQLISEIQFPVTDEQTFPAKMTAQLSEDETSKLDAAAGESQGTSKDLMDQDSSEGGVSEDESLQLQSLLPAWESQPASSSVIGKSSAAELPDEQTLLAEIDVLLKEFETLARSEFLDSGSYKPSLAEAYRGHILKVNAAETPEALSSLISSFQSENSSLRQMILNAQQYKIKQQLQQIDTWLQLEHLTNTEKETFSLTLETLKLGYQSDLTPNVIPTAATLENLSKYITLLQELMLEMANAINSHTNSPVQRSLSEMKMLNVQCTADIAFLGADVDSTIKRQLEERQEKLVSRMESIIFQLQSNDVLENIQENSSTLISDFEALRLEIQGTIQEVRNQQNSLVPSTSSASNGPEYSTGVFDDAESSKTKSHSSAAEDVRASDNPNSFLTQMETDSKSKKTPITPTSPEPINGCGTQFRGCSLQ